MESEPPAHRHLPCTSDAECNADHPEVQRFACATSAVVEWTPVNTTDGHRGLRWPTTMSNWYQEGNQQTTHGDWWIYIDDFAIAAGEHAGGQGEADLPQYPF